MQMETDLLVGRSVAVSFLLVDSAFSPPIWTKDVRVFAWLSSFAC